jgi:hypothetical protein
MDLDSAIKMIEDRIHDLRDKAGFQGGFGGDPSCYSAMVAEYESLLAQIRNLK